MHCKTQMEYNHLNNITYILHNIWGICLLIPITLKMVYMYIPLDVSQISTTLNHSLLGVANPTHDNIPIYSFHSLTI